MTARTVSPAGPTLLDNIDGWLVFIPLALLSFGLVMVASASIDFAEVYYQDPWFFTKRHAIYLVLALAVSLVILSVPVSLWNQYSIVLLFAGLSILIAVLIPGVGRSVNGAQRWISFGSFTIQGSEIAKFCFIIFFASFLSRKSDSFKKGWKEFFKLIFILAVFVLLLLLEPDFGSSVVLCITAGGMMFVAGIPIIRFFLMGLAAISGLAALAVTSPYRWERLVTFLDPWSDQFSSGYQLVQSLIAFGRGEWLGQGLGNSVQKLFFLPEAHTDFIFAIIAEEFGLFGAVVVILAFCTLIWRIILLAQTAHQQKKPFIAFAASGIAILFTAQSFINMGVASGLLPTKGLTLPFISAGGSSLIVSTALMALVLRMSWETRYEVEH